MDLVENLNDGIPVNAIYRVGVHEGMPSYFRAAEFKNGERSIFKPIEAIDVPNRVRFRLQKLFREIETQLLKAVEISSTRGFPLPIRSTI